MGGRYVGSQPPSSSFELHFKFSEKLGFLSTTPQKDVLFHRIFRSVHSSPTRSIDPLASHRPCPSHPVSSDQGPRSHQAWCGLLHTAFFNSWIAFNNRGHRDSSSGRGVPPRSVYLHRCSGPGLEEGTCRYSHPLAVLSNLSICQVVDAVHTNGSYIFLQLWAFGRATDPELLKSEDPSFEFVGASPIPISSSHPSPRPLAVEEIKTYVQWYADAADKAVNKAGFDGVELHFANGYLPDQFLQDVSNQRTDEYGGSIENRARFPLEIIEAVANTVGEDRVGFRVSPWNTWQAMGMEDPKPTFAYFVSQANEGFPNLAYLHAVEPTVSGTDDNESNGVDSNDFLRKIWGDKVFIAAGGYTPQTAAETANTKGGLIAFGRHYIANVSSYPSIHGRSSPDFRSTLARLAIAHQVRCPIGWISTFRLLHVGGPTRLHRLPSRHPLATYRCLCYHHPQDRGHSQPQRPRSCGIRGICTISFRS